VCPCHEFLKSKNKERGTRALGMASAKFHAEIVLAMALARVLLRRIGCWTARDQGYFGWLLLRELLGWLLRRFMLRLFL